MGTLDPTRRVAKLFFSRTPARRLVGDDAAGTAEAVLDQAALALAAEQLGLLGQVLELTVQYAQLRVQFGRAIGSYQAVKHGLADMYSAWEQSTSVVRYAAWAADEAPDELSLASPLAQTFVAPAAFNGAAMMIQFHGGIGYTWEHDAHLY